MIVFIGSTGEERWIKTRPQSRTGEEQPIVGMQLDYRLDLPQLSLFQTACFGQSTTSTLLDFSISGRVRARNRAITRVSARVETRARMLD